MITIGYAKRALETGSREQERMKKYAAVFDEYHMIIFTRKTEGYSDRQVIDNLYLYATNSKTKMGMVLRAWRIGRKILKENQNKRYVVSGQDPFVAGLVAGAVALGNRARYHLQIHGDIFNPLSYQTSLFTRLKKILAIFLIKRTKCIRVVSERIKRSLLEYKVSEKNIKVLPIQADIDDFLQVGKERFVNTVDTTPNPTLSFLYVGRLAEEKNLPLLLKAFARVTHNNQTSHPATLTLLGDGPKKDELLNLIKSLDLTNQVKILPWSNSVPEVMVKHNVLCLASDHEGCGMVLLEAAAAGMAIISTDVGCVGEYVINNHNSLVVPTGDEVGFAAAIAKYINNPKLISEHAENGYKLAKRLKLNEDEYLNKMVEVYSFCLDR